MSEIEKKFFATNLISAKALQVPIRDAYSFRFVIKDQRIQVKLLQDGEVHNVKLYCNQLPVAAAGPKRTPWPLK